MLGWRPLSTLRRAAFLVACLGATAGSVGCSAAEEGDDDTSVAALIARRTLAVEEDPSVLVEHPETLEALERRGMDFGSLFAGTAMDDNRAFAASGEGSSVISAIESDIAGAKSRDAHLGVGMRYIHRAFDVSWLRSSEARFELIAVANRMDRRHATENACGEVHLVYRLAYSNAQATSRLPMTIMLVYPQAKHGDCSAVANGWLRMPRDASPEAKATALTAGPLASLGMAKKIEINVQLVRWPSTTRADMGGHAEYDLRVFERAAGGFIPTKLENTPRTDLSATERAALAAWVGDNLGAIAAGTSSVPSAFLAEQTISAAPKGLSRGANRPFAVLYGKDGEGLGNLDIAGLDGLGTKTALMRRLDTMTCNGCHQARSIAGFHSLGNDHADIATVNALVDGMSPHLHEQAAFRRKDLESVARRETKRAPIPFAEKGSTYAGYGAACGTGDVGFAGWTCSEGLECSNTNGDDVGICVSEGRRKAGEACEESTVVFSANAATDRVNAPRVLTCALPNGSAGRCVRSGGDPGGFPSGMCSGRCDSSGLVEAEGICGVSVPSGFNACIGAGKPFESCIAGGSKQYRRACGADVPCGPDYVCSAVAGAPPGVGACMPPYFLFQARVDGHLVGR
jgi:hypothetical protein